MDVARRSGKSKSVNYKLIFRRIHKWVGLIVGIQLVLWMASGFIMSYYPIEDVHGDHLWHKTAQPSPLSTEDISFNIKDLMVRYGSQEVSNVRLFARNGQAAYEVRLKDETIYLDANDGETLAPITEQQAITIAKTAYQWTGQYKSIENITDSKQYGEIRGRPLPIWKVNFDDDVNTSLYVSPDYARVTTARSDIWRQFDFFWMLHIMDYDTRDNFNTWLLILASSLGFFIALSGMILIFYAFTKKDFRWIRKR